MQDQAVVEQEQFGVNCSGHTPGAGALVKVIVSIFGTSYGVSGVFGWWWRSNILTQLKCRGNRWRR